MGKTSWESERNLTGFKIAGIALAGSRADREGRGHCMKCAISRIVERCPIDVDVMLTAGAKRIFGKRSDRLEFVRRVCSSRLPS